MQTIIAPTDFSDISLNAVNYAADMAIALNVNLLVLHAIELPINVNRLSDEPDAAEVEGVAADDKRRLIRSAKRALAPESLPIGSLCG